MGLGVKAGDLYMHLHTALAFHTAENTLSSIRYMHYATKFELAYPTPSMRTKSRV